jgi:hypothetical protein
MNKRKVHVLLAFTALLLLAVSVGCTGFFQNPTITTLTIGPQNANIQQGSTVQMSAVATYNDGSTKTLNNSVFWSSSDTGVAPISTGGLVTGASPGTATITASSGATTGTTTITVSLNNVTAIQIMPQAAQTVALGGTAQYTCIATVSGNPSVDVTSSVTWTVTDSSGNTVSNISISNQTNPAVVTVLSSATPGTYKVVATYVSNNQTLTNTVTLIVS